MKMPFTLIAMLAMAAMTRVSLAQSAPYARACATVSVKEKVEVASEVIMLADLLSPGTCPTLLRAASRIELGKAPLAGSDRVLDRATLRALVLRAANQAGISADAIEPELRLPERAVLHRDVSLAAERGNLSGMRLHPHAPGARVSKSTVGPGDEVRLLWDQNGIRSVVPATCLDRGNLGDQVRARIQPGGQVVRAKVINVGVVQVGS